MTRQAPARKVRPTARAAARRRLLAAIGPLAIPDSPEQYAERVLAVVLQAKGQR
jgi:hypothetical protein